MDQQPSMIDLGTDAMLELEEMHQDIRHDAPALKEFFTLLKTPASSPMFAGNSAVSLLADIRAYPVLREATGIRFAKSHVEYETVVKRFLEEIESGVDKEDKAAIRKAKQFCVLFLNSVIAKEITEVFLKRGDADESSRATDALI